MSGRIRGSHYMPRVCTASMTSHALRPMKPGVVSEARKRVRGEAGLLESGFGKQFLYCFSYGTRNRIVRSIERRHLSLGRRWKSQVRRSLSHKIWHGQPHAEAGVFPSTPSMCATRYVCVCVTTSHSRRPHVETAVKSHHC